MDKIKKRYLIGVLTLIGFIIITTLYLTNKINGFDNLIYNPICNIRNDILNIIFKIITYMGSTIPVIIITIILMMILNQKDRIILGSSMIITLIINQIIKHLVQRPRPPIIERLVHQGGYSYPSGHSMMALCLYGVLIYFTINKIKSKKRKILLVSILSIIILLIGISRIYVRVHYPSDVLAGYLITITILIINITLINNHFNRGK